MVVSIGRLQTQCFRVFVPLRGYLFSGGANLFRSLLLQIIIPRSHAVGSIMAHGLASDDAILEIDSRQ